MGQHRFENISREWLPAILAIEKQGNAFPWSERNYLDSLEANHYSQVLLLHQTVLGFVIARFYTEEGELLNIGVSPAYRRKGYGKRILGKLIQEATIQEISEINLEVSKSNYAAQRLYRSAGFMQTGWRSQYYRNDDKREDAILMSNKSFLSMKKTMIEVVSELCLPQKLD